MQACSRRAHNFGSVGSSSLHSSSDRRTFDFTSRNLLATRFPYANRVNSVDWFKMSSSSETAARNDPGAQERTRPGSSIEYQSTKGGDVIVVEPSFDAEEGDSRTGPPEKRLSADERDSSSAPHRGHRRNLSEHFQTATSIAPATESSRIPDLSREHQGQDSDPKASLRRLPPRPNRENSSTTWTFFAFPTITGSDPKNLA